MLTNGRQTRRIAAAAIVLAVSACSSSSAVAVVDGVTIDAERFADLHPEGADLSARDVADSALLLVLHEVFTSSALDEFGLVAGVDAIDAAFDERVARYRGRGDLDEQLALIDETRARVLIEAELDVLRSSLSEALVRSEADGFDIDAAYEAYLADEAEVCLRHIQAAVADDYEEARARLEAGEEFEAVARDISIDPLADRPSGESGAGGDLGCRAPSGFPVGVSDAALLAPVGELFGPVPSSVGLHLVIVYEREVPDLDSVRDAVIDHAVASQGPEMFNAWAVAALLDADVSIGDEYGTWGVLPETDPVPTVIPTDRSVP